MSLRAPLLALALLALAPAAGAQPSPQPGPPQQVLQKNLFGEREPGEEEEPDAPQNPAAPEAPPPTGANPSSAAYDARIRQSFAAAEAFQGRLDGGWIVSWRGKDLLQLQLADKGKGQVEGAWRDLRSGPGLNGSGLIDPTPVTNGALDAVFGPKGPGAPPYRLSVKPTAGDRLEGSLRMYDESFDLVTARRAP